MPMRDFGTPHGHPHGYGQPPFSRPYAANGRAWERLFVLPGGPGGPTRS